MMAKWLILILIAIPRSSAAVGCAGATVDLISHNNKNYYYTHEIKTKVLNIPANKSLKTATPKNGIRWKNILREIRSHAVFHTAHDRVTGMHKNNWMKVSIALAAPLLAGTYGKCAGAVVEVDDGGVGGRREGGWGLGRFELLLLPSGASWADEK